MENFIFCAVQLQEICNNADGQSNNIHKKNL